MAVLSDLQLAIVDFLAGFRGDALARIVAIQKAESKGNADVINNTAFADKPAYHPKGANDLPEYSVGISQVNAVAHVPEGQTVDAYAAALQNPIFNAREAFRISSGGTDFSPWSTYTNGSYQSYIPDATNIANAVQSAAGNNGGVLPTGVGWIKDALSGIGGAASDAASGAAGIAKAPLGGIEAVGAFFSALTQSETWWRVGFILGGALLVLFGGAVFLKIHPPKVVPVPV